MLVWRSFHGGLGYKVRTRRICTSQSRPRIGTLLDLFVRVKPNQIWPDRLYFVRHGESAGNVARDAALKAGEAMIDLDVRDVDVPLSELGQRQAIALGRWVGALPPEERPTIVLTSPYLRARHTAGLIVKTAGMSADSYSLLVDERFREKEFGILDRLTHVGVRDHYPDQAEFRRVLGKFYHRPPGGESWCDVILRLRSASEMISREHSAERVLVVGHAVVVLCMRYILEHMTETELLAVDKKAEIANCSVTLYEFDETLGPHGSMRLKLYNFVAPLEEAGAPVTSEPDASVGAR
jgi:broad specificity phosphatase PhoE